MRKTRGPNLISILLLILLSSLISRSIPDSAGVPEILQPVQPRPPTIFMELARDEVNIQTGPGTSGSGSVLGTITIEKPTEARTQTVYVDLYFRCVSEEMLGSVNPHIIEMSPSQITESFTFEVDLQVSPMISTTDIDGTFEISGEWSYSSFDSSGTITPVMGNVILEPFYYFIGSVSNQEELMDVPIGSWATADLVIMNEGNDRVTVQIIEVSENQTLDCEIGTSSVILNNGEDKTVPVRLRKGSGPLGDAVYTQTIRLEARVKGEVITFDVRIHLGTVYTPGSFLRSIWFKLIIVGIILLAVLITAFTIYRKRKRSKRIRLMETEPI